MMDIYRFLENLDVEYQRFDHPAVFTCEEASKLPPMPGEPIKNLFLQDDDKENPKFYVVAVGHDKRVDLKELGFKLGGKLHFGSADKMMELLGVEPGAVTLLGVMNDKANIVTLIIDKILENRPLQCHPLVNTATLVIPYDGIEKFCEATGHALRVLEVPSK